MAYQVGDSPAEPLHVTSYSVDLAHYARATATLRSPEGELTQLVARLENDEVIVEFRENVGPTHPSIQFDAAGIWSLFVQVSGDDAFLIESRMLPAIRFVVEDPTASFDLAWHTLGSARDADWADARDMADMTLYELLESAKHDVLEFAPALDEGEALPVNYRMAQLMHARNRYNAALADPTTGDIGAESFAIPARPLDWQVKQLLRPSRGIPAGW